jgi:hypothetical protein
MYEERNFIIFNTSELDKINFDEVLETSSETIRKSIDGSLTFVKWDGLEIPQSVQSLDFKQGPYSYEEMLEILNTSDWASFLDNN